MINSIAKPVKPTIDSNKQDAKSHAEQAPKTIRPNFETGNSSKKDALASIAEEVNKGRANADNRHLNLILDPKNEKLKGGASSSKKRDDFVKEEYERMERFFTTNAVKLKNTIEALLRKPGNKNLTDQQIMSDPDVAKLNKVRGQMLEASEEMFGKVPSHYTLSAIISTAHRNV